MGNVISIRVPPEIKREMEKLKGEVNWSEEIREFIKKKIKEYKKKKALQEVVAYLLKASPLQGGDAVNHPTAFGQSKPF